MNNTTGLEYSINRKVSHTHTQTGNSATTCCVCFLSFPISTPVFPTFSSPVWPIWKELPQLDQPPLYITSWSCWWWLFWEEEKADGIGEGKGGGGLVVVLCFPHWLTCLTPTTSTAAPPDRLLTPAALVEWATGCLFPASLTGRIFITYLGHSQSETASLSWQWIFFLNIVTCCLTAYLQSKGVCSCSKLLVSFKGVMCCFFALRYMSIFSFTSWLSF